MRILVIVVVLLLAWATAAAQDSPIPRENRDPWISFSEPSFFTLPGTCLPDSTNPRPIGFSFIWAEIMVKERGDESWTLVGNPLKEDLTSWVDPETGRTRWGTQIPVGRFGLYDATISVVDSFGNRSCPSDTISVEISKEILSPPPVSWGGPPN